MNHELLLPALLELLIKSALLLLGAAALAAAARRLSAAQQHALWLAVFAALLVLPLTKCIAPRWHLPGSPTAPVVTVLPTLPEIVIEPAPIMSTTVAPPPKTFHLPDPLHLVIGLWLTGAATIVGYRLLGSLQIAWLRRRSVPIHSDRLVELARQAATEMHLRTLCPIRSSESVRVPCTWGLWRPIVLLPIGAENDWPEARLLAALRHEFAHVARRDYLARWMALLTCALYWPNPLVWLAARRLRMAQEQACDDLVLHAGTPPADYAALLVEAARASLGAPLGLRAAVAMARPSTLEGRVLAIVDETRNRHPAGRATSLAGAFCLAAVIGASALAQIAPEKSPSDTNKITHPIDQILIAAKFIELPEGVFAGIPFSATGDAQISAVLTETQAAETIRKLENQKGVDVLSSPQMTINSGQSGSIQVGRDYDLPPGSRPPTKFVGFSVEVLAVATRNVIDMDFTLRHVALKEEATIATGKPAFDEKRSRFAVTVFDRSMVIASLGPTGKEGRDLFVLVQASKVTPEPIQRPEPKTAATATASVSAPNASPTLKKAHGIILPKIEFREATLAEALDFLRAKAKELDPDKSGVNIVLTPGIDTVRLGNTDMRPADARITMSLTNVPLDDAVRYVTGLAGLKLRVEPNALVLEAPPATASGDAKTPTTLAVPTIVAPDESAALKKAEKIIFPKIETREATLPEMLDFLRAKAIELDPDKTGVNIVLQPGTESDARITVSLTNIPLIEALRYTAGLANLEVRAEPNALILAPPAKAAAENTHTEFTGASFTLNRESNVADASTKLPVNLTADRTRFEDGVAIAEGHVRFSGGPFTATGDSVHYNTAQHSALLTGKVEVRTATSIVTGEEAELFLDGAGRIEAHGPHKTTIVPPPAPPAPAPTTGQVMIPVVPQSKKPFANGDGIEIQEVSGSSATFRVGGTYHVRGVCQQNTIPNASLYLGITTEGDGEGDAVKPAPGTSLSKTVSKGRTEFDFTFTPLRPGKLHVTLYDVDNDNPKDNAAEGLYLGDVAP